MGTRRTQIVVGLSILLCLVGTLHADNRTFKDGFYPGLHRLPDGTIVATTYTTYHENDGGCSIVSVRFKIEEIDALAARAKP